MEICELKDSDEKAWDEYVLKHPDSTFYHQIGWKNVVEKSYGHKSYYLLAKEEGEIKGVLPLFFMKSLIFGKKLISQPFAPYGGAVADNNEIENLLIESAINISKEMGAEYMELRYNTPIDINSKLVTNISYRTMILKLHKNPEIVWNNFNNKVRNATRKSLNLELEIFKGNIEEFYNLYSRNMSGLGTPTHGKGFFENVISEFKVNSDIITVRQNGTPLSSAILLYFKDTVISGWAASDNKHKKLNPNNLLYWSAIKEACENGYEYFDFGRSLPGSGTYRFKKPWGAEEKQLHYVYYLNKIKHIPDTSQANSKRKHFARIWQRLPVSLTKTIGIKMRRNLP